MWQVATAKPIAGTVGCQVECDIPVEAQAQQATALVEVDGRQADADATIEFLKADLARLEDENKVCLLCMLGNCLHAHCSFCLCCLLTSSWRACNGTYARPVCIKVNQLGLLMPIACCGP